MILTLGLLLALKHFVADGPMQTPFMYLNKGKLGHAGGIMHAAIHGVFTALIFTLAGLPVLGLVDFAVHYFVDLTKVKATAKYKWAEMLDFPTQSGPLGLPLTESFEPHLAIYSNWYFYALILDQCLHFATYIVLIWLAVNA